MTMQTGKMQSCCIDLFCLQQAWLPWVPSVNFFELLVIDGHHDVAGWLTKNVLFCWQIGCPPSKKTARDTVSEHEIADLNCSVSKQPYVICSFNKHAWSSCMTLLLAMNANDTTSKWLRATNLVLRGNPLHFCTSVSWDHADSCPLKKTCVMAFCDRATDKFVLWSTYFPGYVKMTEINLVGFKMSCLILAFVVVLANCKSGMSHEQEQVVSLGCFEHPYNFLPMFVYWHHPPTHWVNVVFESCGTPQQQSPTEKECQWIILIGVHVNRMALLKVYLMPWNLSHFEKLWVMKDPKDA